MTSIRIVPREIHKTSGYFRSRISDFPGTLFPKKAIPKNDHPITQWLQGLGSLK
ncbi:MAG: hypothetical protein ABSC15_26425 [Terriglobales bacterium]